MFVKRKTFDKLVNSFLYLENDVIFHNECHRKMIETVLLQDKKIQNLTEVVRVLAKPKDCRKVIGITDDNTKITIGDVLNAQDLMVEIEEEFNVARI